MSTWYVDSAAPNGTNNGTSRTNAWQSLAAITQASLSAGDVVKIYEGTGAMGINGLYNEVLTITKGGGGTGNRITYQGISGNYTPVIRGVDTNSFSCIAIIGIEITATGYPFGSPPVAFRDNAFIFRNTASGWLIQDNYVHDTWADVVGSHPSTGPINSFNTVRHNCFQNISFLSGGTGGACAIVFPGNSNLIEYNIFTSGLDRTRPFATGNVIRNNFMGPTDTILFPNTVPFPNHTDDCQGFDSSLLLTQLLYERNFSMNNHDSNGGTNAHGMLVQNFSGNPQMTWFINRFNISIRVGGGPLTWRNTNNVNVYNETYIAPFWGATSNFNDAVGYEAVGWGATGADWRNLTCNEALHSLDAHYGWLDLTNGVYNASGTRLHCFNSSGSQMTYPTGATGHNNWVTGTLPIISPNFTNTGTDDYTLQAGSILIGSGAQVAVASGNGTNSTQLWVYDAQRIFDGWGIAEPDLIKIGSGGYVRVSGINYTTNLVTLSQPLTWVSGSGVYVFGTEDVGALPFAYALPLFVANTSSGIASGVTGFLQATGNTNAIRKVEFLVDGLPVGTSYTNPYAVQWVGDGLVHSGEARAYNMWASQILSVSSTIMLGTGSNSGPVTGVLSYRRYGPNPKMVGLSFY